MTSLLAVMHAAGVAELTLSRPAARNALSGELIAALDAELRRAEQHADTRCVILTGAPPAFSAGLDLSEVAGAAADSFDTTALLRLLQQIEELGKPVIAAVNGPALAGGAALALACDAVLCSEEARFGFSGIRHGLVAPVLLPWLLRAVGARRARYLLLTGETVAAADAVRYGLADDVVPPADLMKRARQLAGTLAACPPEALRATKALVGRWRESSCGLGDPALRALCTAVPLPGATRVAIQRFLKH